MNTKKASRWIIAIIIVAILLCVFAETANAEPLSPETDYMAAMEAAVVKGDSSAGKAAESMRNAKIDELGLTYQKIAFEDLMLLSKIIYAEAGSEWLSDEWKMSVGEVVLNRVASPEFPNTIREVLEQPGQYYGKNSWYFNHIVPSLRCVDDARRLLEGERVLNNPSVVFQSNGPQGSGTFVKYYDKYLGWTYFCYSNYPELYEEAAG